MAVSDVGLSAKGSSNFSAPLPAFVTQKTSGKNPSTCSASFLKLDSGITAGKSAGECPLDSSSS
jgi:hypothetical protein